MNPRPQEPWHKPSHIGTEPNLFPTREGRASQQTRHGHPHPFSRRSGTVHLPRTRQALPAGPTQPTEGQMWPTRPTSAGVARPPAPPAPSAVRKARYTRAT
jgi:hypothetical protein